MQGTIKKWIDEKNFGFIDIGEDKDLFFHRNEVAEGYTPQEGDTVEFEKQQGDKGPMAVKVRKAGEASEAPAETTEEEAPAETTEEEAPEAAPAEEAPEAAE